MMKWCAHLFVGVSHSYAPKNFDLALTNRATSLAKPSIKEPLVLELKTLLFHLHYAILGAYNTLSVINVANLLEWKIKALVCIL